MSRLMVIGLLGLSLTLWPTLALAACTTTVINNYGPLGTQQLICSTCCFMGTCSTTCYTY